ncbi:MAG: preprotein translocase subunit SecE [Patescibacteria group bacterium]
MQIQNPLSQIPGAFNFFREVRMEGKRVNWPTRDKTIKDTIIVIAFAVAIALFLSFFDYAFQFILDTFLL